MEGKKIGAVLAGEKSALGGWLCLKRKVQNLFGVSCCDFNVLFY